MNGFWKDGAEAIGSGTHDIDGGVAFHAEKLHALGFPGGLAGFGDAGGVFGRDENRCGGIRRDRDIHREFSAFAFPIAHDATVGRVVVRLHPGHIADDGGLDDRIFEAGCSGVGLDAGEALVEPVVRRGEARVDVRPEPSRKAPPPE